LLEGRGWFGAGLKDVEGSHVTFPPGMLAVVAADWLKEGCI
jgi:hypothetical protein